MDFGNIKEKLRFPFELLKKIKEVLLDLWLNLFSLAKGLPGYFTGGSSEGEPSPQARKKKLVLLGLGAAAVLLFGLLIAFIIALAKPAGNGLPSVAAGTPIPTDEFFFPPEPDFLPGFVPVREPRRFWGLDEIRPYWKAPGNPGWWMDAIESTVDSIMEGVP